MVEFGLKLEDNKVAEWSDRYIDYEKLKALLKKAKSAAEKLATAEAECDPELVRETRASYTRRASEGRLSRSSSKSSLAALPLSLSGVSLHNLEVGVDVGSGSGGGGQGGDDEHGILSENENSPENETDPLVARKGSEQEVGVDGTSEAYGSMAEGGGEAEMLGRESAVPLDRKEGFSAVKKVVSGVAGYFQKDGEDDENMKQRDRLEELMAATDDQILEFSSNLYQQIEKVNNFYREKLDDNGKRLDNLVESAETLGLGMKNVVAGSEQMPDEEVGFATLLTHQGQAKKSQTKEEIQHKRESDSIRRAIKDMYRTTKLLENYAIINYTGFFKIIKKFNKNFPSNKGKFKEAFEQIVCHEGQEAEALGDRMEILFANWFCGGNTIDARVQILPKRGDILEMDWTQFKLGFHLGMCAILALWVFWDCVWGLVRDGNSTIGARTAFPVFRGCGGLLLVHWFWGLSVFLWSRYRINYIFLFDFDPRTVRSPIMIFDDAVNETLVFLVLMLLYYKSGAHDIPEALTVTPGIFPFILVLYTIKKLVFPLQTRAPLWRSIQDVISTPLTSPIFFHSFVADWFTSMVKVFQDLAWTLCFVVSGDFLLSEDKDSGHTWEHQFWYRNVLIPLICLAPLWFRFNQSLRRYVDTGKRWPNLANAFKYALSQTVTLFGAFHPLYLYYQDKPGKNEVVSGVDIFQVLWMGLFISSSLYSYFWDVYMDWGLGRPKYKFLGPRLMYPRRLHYYGVIFIDLFLRFMWVMTLVPPQSGAKFVLPSYLTAITMTLELVRRTMWGLFRLENEHRHSTDKYRKVDFVPLHFSTGHSHKYEQKDSVGWSVLGEVALVNLGVITVMVVSVVAAQKAAHHASL